MFVPWRVDNYKGIPSKLPQILVSSLIPPKSGSAFNGKKSSFHGSRCRGCWDPVLIRIQVGWGWRIGAKINSPTQLHGPKTNGWEPQKKLVVYRCVSFSEGENVQVPALWLIRESMPGSPRSPRPIPIEGELDRVMVLKAVRWDCWGHTWGRWTYPAHLEDS